MTHEHKGPIAMMDEASADVVPGKRHVMRAMTPEDGDLKLTWSPDNKDEVEAAKEQFDKLRKKGHAAYAVKKDGSKGKVVTEFDPDAEMLILSPAPQGG